MRRRKNDMLRDLDLATALIARAREELLKVETASHGEVVSACAGQYSLAKVKRNCTTARELLLGVRKGCDYE